MEDEPMDHKGMKGYQHESGAAAGDKGEHSNMRRYVEEETQTESVSLITKQDAGIFSLGFQNTFSTVHSFFILP